MRLVLATLVSAVLMHGASPGPEPYVLRSEPPGMSFGLLYTPEGLAALVADKSPGDVPARIADAIREGQAIVVMWTFPAQMEPVPPPRPYKIAVANYNPALKPGMMDTPWNIPDLIGPLWIEQDAADLARIDPRAERREVGAMAAFPRSAFVPGRRLYLWLGPQAQAEPNRFVAATRYTTIEWNGNQATAQRR